jgi:hypothetical protein
MYVYSAARVVFGGGGVVVVMQNTAIILHFLQNQIQYIQNLLLIPR